MDENKKEPSIENAGFQFGIRTLFWVTAILSVSMALLGPGFGFYLGVLVIVIHALWQTYRNTAFFLLCFLLFFISIALLLLPAVANVRPIARRNQSLNHLKQLAVSMHIYSDIQGYFPPPFSKDDNGQPLHSWRTLLLPFIEQEALYKKIQLDEAWDSPANKQILEGIQIPVLRSPQEPAREAAIDVTHYLAIVDEQTVWSPSQLIKLADISDGGANTIVLMEVAGREIPWHEPRDLTLDEAIDILIGEDGDVYNWIRPGFFVSDRLQGDGLVSRVVAYADGHVGTIHRHFPDRETARAFLTRSGGEDHEGLANRTSHREPRVIGHIVHWGRIWGVVVFIALAVGPFFTRRRTI